ncbi:uncharacterized protein LOC116012119 [Ipomoea triloba]|uniref:uncharacterized protein LOC116012119 n=1 Tax=Ipomoea triloba TaxID=35885 RepID=UPI00125DCCF2|nr:uncharacterized protein LOC116012119 [Ipomoea triloba]
MIVGITCNFIAELWGLRECLIRAKDRKMEKIVVKTDSKAMVHTIKGESGSRPKDDTLITDCKAIMSQIRDIDIIHVLREGNQCADYLVNLGQTSDWGTMIVIQLSEDIKTLLEKDVRSVATRRVYKS